MRLYGYLNGTVAAAIFLLGVQPYPAFGAAKRALLIGINRYQTPSAASLNDLPTSKGSREFYSNLDGCLNDVEGIRQLLVARFGFRADDIYVLADSQARRESILGAIRNHLIDEPSVGDVCFFYYAGHGSRIRNLRSNKLTGMDSTLVPADSNEGAMDIRDKELARLFNKALDKGVILTAVFDSCHSGSIARGLASDEKIRMLPPESRIVSDPPDPGLAPEDRGALIISAAQDYQSAMEASDENNTPHGAFTLALLKTLRTVPPDATAEDVFLSTQVMLQTWKPQQVPVLAGTGERRRKSFLGLSSRTISGGITVGVTSINPAKGAIALRGGRAIGLYDGCELRRLPQIVTDSNEPPIRVQITKVQDLAESTAKVISGDVTKISVGNVFEVDRWTYSAEAMLHVWIPSSEISCADEKQLRQEFGELRRCRSIQWLRDPTEETPTHVLSWDRSGWVLTPGGSMGQKLKASDVIQRLVSLGESKPKLFVSAPVVKELTTGLKLGRGTLNDSIQPVTSKSEADYFLVGRWESNKLEYCWLRPNSIQDDAQISPLPARSDWFEIEEDVKMNTQSATELEARALRIAKLRAWLSLGAAGSTGHFPYRLALKNTESKKTVGFGENVIENESYALTLVARPNASLATSDVEKRWVYVVAVDSWGKTQLLFPRDSQGNVGNRLPYDAPWSNSAQYPSEISLEESNNGNSFTISEPFGIDTYVLLTSRQEIPQPSLLNGDSVRTRGTDDGPPLQSLFANIGARTRGINSSVPTDWSVQKILIRSVTKIH